MTTLFPDLIDRVKNYFECLLDTLEEHGHTRDEAITILDKASEKWLEREKRKE